MAVHDPSKIPQRYRRKRAPALLDLAIDDQPLGAAVAACLNPKCDQPVNFQARHRRHRSPVSWGINERGSMVFQPSKNSGCIARFV